MSNKTFEVIYNVDFALPDSFEAEYFEIENGGISFYVDSTLYVDSTEDSYKGRHQVAAVAAGRWLSVSEVEVTGVNEEGDVSEDEEEGPGSDYSDDDRETDFDSAVYAEQIRLSAEKFRKAWLGLLDK